MRQIHILDLGVQPKGTTVTVTSADEETSEIQMYAYSYDFDGIYDSKINIHVKLY